MRILIAMRILLDGLLGVSRRFGRVDFVDFLLFLFS